MVHQQPDFDALTRSALSDIQRAEAVQAAALQKTVQRRHRPKMTVALVVALLVVAAMDSKVPVYWLGVSDNKQLAEMTAALQAANLAVTQAYTTTGSWPDRVPLPALASLVELQNAGPQYRLLAKTSHWQLTMTPSGDLQKAPP